MSISGVVAAAGAARVPIPTNLRKTIHDIKEIAAGKHSEDDIYATLKECNMDPNETAQRLLYLDTFREVKSKREKKKGIDQASEGYRRVSGMQQQGARGDFGGRRQATAQPESRGINNYRERKSRPSAAVHEREKNAVPSISSSSNALINGPKKASNVGFNHETASRVAFGDSNRCMFASTADTNLLTRVPPRPTVDLKQLSSSNSGPITPTPTDISIYMPDIRPEGVIPASESGVYSYESDPILVPSLSPRNPGAVGTIKREKGSTGSADHIPIQDEASETINSSNKTTPTIPQDDWPAKQIPSHSKVMASQAETVELKSNTPAPPQLNDSVLDQLTPELDRKLNNLSIFAHQPVIFPDHLQVPEAIRKMLTFGSLDANLGQSANCEKVSMPTSENISASDLAGSEEFKSNHCAPSTNKEGENSICPPSHPEVTETSSTQGENTSSSCAAPEYDQPKQGMLASVGESLYPLLQTAPHYGFGFVPPVLGPHLMHLERSKPQVGHSTTPSSSGSTPPLTQPSGLGQNSFAIPPHLLPFLRHPYPPNFIPCSPYFPHLYLPHNAHQLFGHGVLPQQPGNIYVPPVAAGGVKFPVSPLYKAGTVAGNLPYFGIPSGYGSYAAPTVGYNPSPGFTSSSGSSGGNEDLATSEIKEKNTSSALKQNEESNVWTSARVRGLTPLQANYVYNIPPAQHIASPPTHSGHGAFPGVYHLSNTSVPPTTIQSLPKQPQTAAGSGESVVPTSTHPQPPSQINWNTQILNRENS